MKTVSFVSKKGGVAKTTSAIRYAYWLTLKDYAVTLIDDDNNRTASNWADGRKVTASLRFRLESLAFVL